MCGCNKGKVVSGGNGRGILKSTSQNTSGGSGPRQITRSAARPGTASTQAPTSLKLTGMDKSRRLLEQRRRQNIKIQKLGHV